jgi:hypothetical protein
MKRHKEETTLNTEIAKYEGETKDDLPHGHGKYPFAFYKIIIHNL